MTSFQRKAATAGLITIVAACICIISVILTLHFSHKSYRILTSPQELMEIAERASEDELIIDIRDRADYELAHVENSIYLEFVDGSEIDHYLTATKAKNKTIYLLCYSGSRSARLFHYLMAQGYPDLVYIKFGYNEFAESVGSDYTPATGPCTTCSPWAVSR